MLKIDPQRELVQKRARGENRMLLNTFNIPYLSSSPSVECGDQVALKEGAAKSDRVVPLAECNQYTSSSNPNMYTQSAKETQTTKNTLTVKETNTN